MFNIIVWEVLEDVFKRKNLLNKILVNNKSISHNIKAINHINNNNNHNNITNNNNSKCKQSLNNSSSISLCTS